MLGVEQGQLMGKRECLRFLMYLHQCEQNAAELAPAASPAASQSEFSTPASFTASQNPFEEAPDEVSQPNTATR